MKKILAFILAALMLLTLAACSSNGGNTDPQPDNDQNQTDEPGKVNTDKKPDTQVEELFGYSFTFDGSVIERSSIDGMVAETDEYSLFIYCLNDISFNTWDDIIDLAFKQMRNSMDAVFRFYPTEQTNSTSSKTENNYGETILKVSGTMEGDQTGEANNESAVHRILSCDR